MSSETQRKAARASKRKRLRVTLAASIAALALGAGAWAWFGSRSKVEAITYRESSVVRESISSTVLSTGTVAPENKLEIKTPIAGRIERVLIEEGQRVRKGQTLGWMSSTERAALLDAASAKGPEELERWEDLYKSTPILAPLNGMIIARNVEAGQTVTNTEAVFVLSDRLIVKAQVDETDLALVRLKQNAVIILDAYPTQRIPAEVVQIAYDAKTVNNVTTYAIDVLPKEVPAHMRSGMTANVTFIVAERPTALAIPTEAIATREGKFFVKTGPIESPTDREIKAGITDGKRTEVVEGLNEGDTVLIAQLRSKGDAATGPSSPFSPFGRGPAQRKGK